ncbi:MAG: exodeoxyribonuclease VII large subunit [Candidatus Saccharimonadales bacterium]
MRVMQLTPEIVELTVSDFVAVLNQTLDFAYPEVVIIGELANFRVSKNRWVYFDLKDEMSSVKFFGTVNDLPGPLEDGMMLRVHGNPRLHNLYGFSVNIRQIQPIGEGSIRRAADLLAAKLAKEGIFDESRKRPVPYPPKTIGLITSTQSAAYADFIKIINARWKGIEIQVLDVQVQGDIAARQIVSAIKQFGEAPTPPEVLVLIRGGGSPDDLAAFSTESVTRAVAGSRIPTMVAIGHEIDVSLAELAADMRASSPSNAAELMVPDRKYVLEELANSSEQLRKIGEEYIIQAKSDLKDTSILLNDSMVLIIERDKDLLSGSAQLLEALNPIAILKRGYAIVRFKGAILKDANKLSRGNRVGVELAYSGFNAVVEEVTKNKEQ